MASRLANSTSWGSLVRAQYRPPSESPAQAGFLFCLVPRASPHECQNDAGRPWKAPNPAFGCGLQIISVHRFIELSIDIQGTTGDKKRASWCSLKINVEKA